MLKYDINHEADTWLTQIWETLQKETGFDKLEKWEQQSDEKHCSAYLDRRIN